jgi:hypothetical protein
MPRNAQSGPQPVERCADAGFGLLRVQPVQQQDRPSLRILG